MQESRHITDSNFTIFDKLSNSHSIGDINLTKSTPIFIIPIHYLLSICDNIACNMNMILHFISVLLMVFSRGIVQQFQP